MKIKRITPKYRSNTRSIRAISGLSLLAAAAVSCLSFATPGHAANVLQNSGFETGSGLVDWLVQSTVTWNIQPGNAQGKLYHSGANSMWTQGVYNGGPNLTYAYQTVACAPGSTYSAEAFFSQYVTHDSAVGEGGDNGTSGLFTSDGSGQEDGWVEVRFLDSSNNVLADYRSAIMDPAFVSDLANNGATVTNGAEVSLAWVDCQVTNQYDISQMVAGADPDTFPYAVTNTLASGQYMVAPPGSVNVQYRLVLFQALYESGATYWDDCSLDLVGGPAPSVISNVSPDGSKLFNGGASAFTFNVASSSSGGAPLPDNPTNGIKVVVNGTDQSAKLQFSGDLQNWNVSLPTITSNQIYNISITVSNSAGLTTTHSTTFDTFATNNFIVYVEDYDFNGGQYIQNPVPTNAAGANSYWGTAGTVGIDQDAGASVTAGGNTLAPNYPNRTDGNVAFQVASDLPLPLYSAQNNSSIYNVNLSYNNAGVWENYTRNPYPQGNYVVYARISGGNGTGVEYLNLLTSGYGTSTQTTTNLGSFVLTDGNSWSTYKWLPLTDSFGNLAIVNIPAGQQTLQLLSGGGENVIDFMFVPASGVAIPPVVTLLSPNFSTQSAFLGGTTSASFSVVSSSSTVAQTNVQVTLNGADVSQTEVFSGNSTNWTVTVPIPANKVLTMVITATDASGRSKSVTQTFDTFTQNNYMVEAEDFDFAGGQFIDNPIPTGNTDAGLATFATNSYYVYPENNSANTAVQDVDYSDYMINAGELYNYRPLDLAGTDAATDFIRQKFIVNGGTQTNSDYYIGWWNQGTWLNYTRTYPAGSYYVYGRLAGGGAYTGLTLSLVTSGVGTTSQTTQTLGTFSDSTANGWQNWHWVPLLGTNGQPAVVTLGGVETLRATAGTGANANYYMFVPVTTQLTISATVIQGKIIIQIPTQNGANYTVLYKNNLADATWQTLGTSVPGTGSTVMVTNSMTQLQQFYKVMKQ